ncbi:hypothetical protein EB118_22400 [bacterium]|nr:hypothetical protein [bacterium]
MEINQNEIWNDHYVTYKGKYGEEPKFVSKHNIFKHEILWFDPITTTVAEAVDASKSEQIKFCNDSVDLMLLIKHEGEDKEVLQFALGYYSERDNIPEPIMQFRYSNELEGYAYFEPEGEIFAFALIDDLPLMMKFNDNE